MQKRKINFPIAIKLVSITAGLMLATAIPIAFKSSALFEDTSAKRESDTNAEQASARANEIENVFNSYVDKIKVVASLMSKQYPTPEEKEAALELSFKNDRDIVNVDIYELKDNKTNFVERITNEEYLKQYEVNKDYIENLRGIHPFPIKSLFSGNIEIQNSSHPKGAPLFTLGIPFVKDDFGNITHVAVADFRLDRIQKVFSGASARIIYLLDKDGKVLAHPNDKLALQSQLLSHIPIVKKALEAKTRSGQLKFIDPDLKEPFVGAYARTSFGMSVIAQAPEEIILEPAKAVRREAFRIAGFVLSGALFLIFLFSITLTSPLERLLDVTKEIGKGNFEVKSNISSSDEVGVLASSIEEMAFGLKERDKAKDVLKKFHGAVAEEFLKGDVQLGGTNKQVTVFFSDVRDFTKFSEGHTPEEVVEMLNEYFQIMVGIAVRNHGVVDKFVGDAMMVIWGAPKSTGEDNFHAVKASLEMRAALAELNVLRQSRNQVPIKIGIGLHSGRAISGQMGSTERMEYTVIGDTVNLASRIESSTKAFGTDLLISEAIVNDVQNKYIVEYAGAAEVKGKSEPIKMYKVRGYIKENGEQQIVQTPYSDYESGDADKVKIAAS